MVYGELGRYPFIINVKVRMISFWGKLLIFRIVYCLLYVLCIKKLFKKKKHGDNLYKAFYMNVDNLMCVIKIQ